MGSWAESCLFTLHLNFYLLVQVRERGHSHEIAKIICLKKEIISKENFPASGGRLQRRGGILLLIEFIRVILITGVKVHKFIRVPWKSTGMQHCSDVTEAGGW